MGLMSVQFLRLVNMMEPHFEAVTLNLTADGGTLSFI
jgi:hypothetical protein